MGKRVFLFLVTNLLIVLTLSVVLNLLGFSGYLGPRGQVMILPLAIFCLFWGMGGAFISLQISRWMAKRALGVQLIDGRTGNAALDELYATVQRLARQANLPLPEVGIYESDEVNAFATGPSKKRSLVAVSTGMLRSMDRPAIEGVLGHEISHIANGDMVTMTLLQGVINAFVMFFARLVAFAVRQAMDSRAAWMVSWLVMIALEIGLGILGSLVTAWFSRRREFHADAGSAALAGRENMIRALRQLKARAELVDPSAPALASFKIAGSRSWLRLFSTHPDLDLRIAALERGSF